MGLAQAGMIRRKNALSMLMQTLTGMAIGSLLWFIIGFSLVFGPSHKGMIGGFHDVLLIQTIDTGPDTCNAYAPTIPALLFVAFHMMFALMTPVICTGAFAERLTFEGFLVFVTIWPLFVYYPLAHWIWNTEGFLFKIGVRDFAGGLVIHASSGIAALIISAMLQRRRVTHAKPHSIPLMILGGCLIWAGWYSFNGGSAYQASPQAASALLSTHISACSGSLVWVLAAYRADRRWHLTEIMNGAFAGLAAITPGSGFVTPQGAIAIGVIGAALSFASVRFFKRFGGDDALDVMSLQGTPGIAGTILASLFASGDFAGVEGLFYGGSWSLVGAQALGVVVSVVWAGFWTGIIMLILDATVGIDVSPETEEMGLDLAQIGE